MVRKKPATLHPAVAPGYQRTALEVMVGLLERASVFRTTELEELLSSSHDRQHPSFAEGRPGNRRVGITAVWL